MELHVLRQQCPPQRRQAPGATIALMSTPATALALSTLVPFPLAPVAGYESGLLLQVRHGGLDLADAGQEEEEAVAPGVVPVPLRHRIA